MLRKSTFLSNPQESFFRDNQPCSSNILHHSIKSFQKSWGTCQNLLYLHQTHKYMTRQFLTTFLLLLAISLHAQDYQPFHAGKLHYFSSASNYSLRVDSVGLAGNDSAFWMNEIALFPSPACTTFFPPNYYRTPLFIPGHEGFFGDRFIRPAGWRPRRAQS